MTINRNITADESPRTATTNQTKRIYIPRCTPWPEWVIGKYEQGGQSSTMEHISAELIIFVSRIEMNLYWNQNSGFDSEEYIPH